jgi:hypothetical protein
MTLVDKLSRLLLAPPATGWRVLIYGLVLIAIPTLLRIGLNELIQGRLAFFVYIPFVILAGALLTWRHAAIIALACGIIADFFFVEPSLQIGISPYEVIGFAIFTVSSVLIIALVEAVRTIVENSLRPARPEGLPTPVVFSLEGGQAWVSWYGSHSWVRLGPEQEVAEIMEDFLAQRELAVRLNRQATGKNP